MADPRRVKEGMTLYTRSGTLGNTKNSRRGKWPLKVLSIATHLYPCGLRQKRYLVSWNYNAPRWTSEEHIRTATYKD